MLILFDIDGTLLVTRGAGKRAFLRACREILGREVDADAVRFAGNTDPLLFRAFCAQVGQPFDPDRHEAFAETYRLELAAELEHASEACVLPGVEALLARLEERGDVTLGLLTGNYARTAPLKLRALGLDPERFAIQVFGDEGPARADLPPIALQRYRRSYGKPPREAWIVGDTVADVACATASGLPCLAVATGLDSRETLEEAGAHVAVPDLSDTAGILRHLGLDPT